jgi:hypothetical protein
MATDYTAIGGGGSGMLVNTGEVEQKLQYQTGSGTYRVEAPKMIDAATLETYEADLFNNNPAQWESLYKLYKSAGYSSWKEAVVGASMDNDKYNRSWEDFLKARAANPVIQKLVAASGSGGSGGPFYSRDTSVNLSSLSEAAQIADQTFTQELGRTASDQEAAAFQKALNKQQQMNPQVSIQSGTQTKGSRVSQSKQTGGFDATRFAREYAQSQEGYGERFAGITFMDVIDKAISDPNALDQIIAGG